MTSTCVPLPIENIDTDQIIPARFLKATTRDGFGENLFRDWRYAPDGKPNPDFVLNKSQYAGEILVAGKNFGCGSSREHAAWAISDYGFKAVVSSFFADIFKNNALNNHLLPVQVTEDFLQGLLEGVAVNPKLEIVIDLPSQSISVPELQMRTSFHVNAYKKMCLQQGLDDIDYLLSLRTQIEAHERANKGNTVSAFV